MLFLLEEIFFGLLFTGCLITAKDRPTGFFEEIFNGKRITTGIQSTRKVASLLQCIQYCSREKVCSGVNFSKEIGRCEIFHEIHKDLLIGDTNWNVYAAKAVCYPNPCKNGGRCILLKDNNYDCECTNMYVGRHCETDIAFELEFKEKDSYLRVPVNIPSQTQYTMCFVFSGSLPPPDTYQTIMSYCSRSTEGYTKIRIESNENTFRYTINERTETFGSMPQKDLPRPICIALKNEKHGGEITILFGNEIVKKRKVDKVSYFFTPGLLTFGVPMQDDDCRDVNTDEKFRYKGKVSFFLMFNQTINEQDMRNFAKLIWRSKHLVLTWDKMRNKSYQRGDVKDIRLRF